MVNSGEAAQNAYNVAVGCMRAWVVALTDMQSNQSEAHCKMADTQFEDEGCEDHPPFG